MKLPPLPEPTGRLDDYSEHDMRAYGQACATAAVAAALAPVTKPTRHYQPQSWPFQIPHDHERQEVTGLSIPETPA